MSRQRTRTKGHEDRKEKRSPLDLYDAAFRHFQSDRWGSAEDRCRRALALDPNHADSLHLLGLIHMQSGKFDRSLAISPDQVEVLRKRGVCLGRLNRRDEAITQFRKATELKPDFVVAFYNLGSTLRELKRFEEALSTFDHALSLSPDHPEIINNRGNVLLALGRYEDALAHYDRAIALKPDFVEAHGNRGLVLDELFRMDEAAESHRKSLALKPDNALGHLNLSFNRLRSGDFKAGWAEAEWRWKCAGLHIQERNFGCPLWLGAEPVRGKTILLHSDQALGDALQFCRYVPLVAAMGARVILEVQKELRELVSGLDGISTIVSRGEALPDFDLHCSLGSLPLAFDTTLDTIPSATPYIWVGDHAGAWKNRLASVKSPRVGLVWSGNPNHTNDRNRSIALEALLPLLEVKASFVSLQKDVRSADRAVLDQRKEILDIGPELKSFVDTAAVVSQLDLVISVDTSVAHLAGALDRPVWILLPYVPDWRWLLHRTDSLWYPTARLFRQSETRDWRTVVQQVRTELDSLMLSLPMAPNNPKRAAK